jgi:hypothetical protein
MPAARHRRAADAVAACGLRPTMLGQGLLVAAVAHPQRAEHQLLGQLRERQAGQVDQQLLQDAVPAAGVAELQPRNGPHPHRRRVAAALEHLDQAWGGLVQG